MIDKNGNKIISDADKPFDFEFARKEIAFFMKHYRAAANGERAFIIAKMIRKYLKNGGNQADVADDFYEVESYAPRSRSEDFIWYLVYVRRLLCDAEKTKKNYEAAYDHRLQSARHFEQICSIKPSFYNKRVMVWEYMMASDIALNSKEKSMLDDSHREPLRRAKELLCELDGHKDALNNKDYFTTAKYVYQDDALFMERTNTAKGEVWDGCIRNLVYYSGREYRLEPDSSTKLRSLSLYYNIALRCDGYASPEVVAELDELIAIAQSSSKANEFTMRIAIKGLRDTRIKYIKKIEK